MTVVNDKLAIARSLPGRLENIFHVSLICFYVNRLKARKMNCKRWGTEIFSILHSAPYKNNLLWKSVIFKQTELLLTQNFL